jgi:hypothetical protein
MMSSTDSYIAAHPVTILVENTTIADFKLLLASPSVHINGACDAIRAVQEY